MKKPHMNLLEAVLCGDLVKAREYLRPTQFNGLEREIFAQAIAMIHFDEEYANIILTDEQKEAIFKLAKQIVIPDGTIGIWSLTPV